MPSLSTTHAAPPLVPTRAAVLTHFKNVRRQTQDLCDPLQPADFIPQSMPDASPVKWHLAHTTWFFETFVLAKFEQDYEPFDPAYNHLFNSYYNLVGVPFSRPMRGTVTRPSVPQVFGYRDNVTDRVVRAVNALEGDALRDALEIVEVGIHHEQQHQELMLTDLKHLFSCNPLMPTYMEDHPIPTGAMPPDLRWIAGPDEVQPIGHDGETFSYDNERPRHRVFLEPYEVADRLVTNGEFIEFIEAGGYETTELWLDMGWRAVESGGWRAPLYWFNRDGAWREFTLHGARPVDPHAPATHVSYFEADAYARWRGVRLPTEFEWEAFAADREVEGQFVESGVRHPAPQSACKAQPDREDGLPIASSTDAIAPSQLFGTVWQWTASQYLPYPGFTTPEGALGEYNGKWMCNQFVLRGGSCATSASHIRRTYRNFFDPAARWQYTGIRLARGLA